MAKFETAVQEFKINRLTKEQYNSIENPSDTELYCVTDENMDYNDLINKPVFNGIALDNTNKKFFGTSSTAASEKIKEVSIPSIETLEAGQIIIVSPVITSSAYTSSVENDCYLKLNDFPAYPIRYNNNYLTSSSMAGWVWNQNYPTMWLFDGTYWRFLTHGVDNNTTYTINYSVDNGNYIAGVGNYVISRYSLIMQKPDMTWEKITDPNVTYSIGTTKTANTSGFLLNQIRYYNTTTNLATGAKTASNVCYEKAATFDIRYSTNCGNSTGWSQGDYIYLVGTINPTDGLFYLDTTQWWTNTLPNSNDGKLYIRVGVVITGNSYNVTLHDVRPIFYHNGIKLCEYKVADNKQDLLVSGTNIKTINNNSIVGSGDVHIDSLPSQSGNTGKFLTTDGTDASWADVDAFPDQTGNTGKYLTTNGTTTSWDALATVANSGSYNDLSDKPTINDLTSQAQQDALNSGIDYSKTSQITTNQNDIATIQGKIPSAASTSNQLADKDFVNSTVTTL